MTTLKKAESKYVFPAAAAAYRPAEIISAGVLWLLASLCSSARVRAAYTSYNNLISLYQEEANILDNHRTAHLHIIT